MCEEYPELKDAVRTSVEQAAEYMGQMEFAYAKATDLAVVNGIAAGATDGGNRTFDAAGLLDFIADGAADIYSNSLGFARNLLVSPTAWGTIMGFNDAGRPIYNASQPQNAAGQVGPTSLIGNVAGLNLYVSRNVAASGDFSMYVINPDAYTWYEGSKTTLRTDILATGQIKVAIVGYGALAEKLPLAGVWNDIAI